MLVNVAQSLWKIESSYGVDPTLAAANAVRTLGPVTITPVHTSTPVPGINSKASDKTPVAGDTHVDIACEVEAHGSGSAGTAPEWGPILRACGWSETISGGVSVTYKPDIGLGASVAMQREENGLRSKYLGCRGRSSLTGEAGGFAKFAFNLKGIYADEADAALTSSPVFDTTKPVPLINITASLHSVAALIKSFTLEFPTNPAAAKAMSSTYGISGIYLEKHAITGTMVVEKPLVAGKAWVKALADGSTGGLSIALGATAGNIITITSSLVKLTSIAEGVDAGLRTLTIGFSCSETSTLGDDMSIVLT